jgi:hypothetical protein
MPIILGGFIFPTLDKHVDTIYLSLDQMYYQTLSYVRA